MTESGRILGGGGGLLKNSPSKGAYSRGAYLKGRLNRIIMESFETNLLAETSDLDTFASSVKFSQFGIGQERFENSES